MPAPCKEASLKTKPFAPSMEANPRKNGSVEQAGAGAMRGSRLFAFEGRSSVDFVGREEHGLG